MPASDATRIRRRLEAVSVTPPDEDVIEEILRWAISDGIVDAPDEEGKEEARNRHFDNGYDAGVEFATDHDAFDRGYDLGKSGSSKPTTQQGA